MAKIKSKGFFCCDNFILDKSNKASLIGIFGKISLETVPGKLLKLVLVSMFEFEFSGDTTEEEKIKIDFKLFDPNGKPVAVKIPSLEIKANPLSPTAAIALELGNVEFTVEGKHTFKVYVSGKEFNSLAINVNKKNI